MLLASQSLVNLIAKLDKEIKIMEQFPMSSPIVQLYQQGISSDANQRHPSSNNLKQYNSGIIEIEPHHALIQSIEYFLVVRDYGRVRMDKFDDEN